MTKGRRSDEMRSPAFRRLTNPLRCALELRNGASVSATDAHERENAPVAHANELADRRVSLWNEPVAARRRQLIAELWAEVGAHLLQPPREMRELAVRPGIGLTARLEARGHAALEARMTTAYEQFVASGTFTFRSRGNADRVADAVTFNSEVVCGDGEVATLGLEFLVPAPDRRIRSEFQFIGT
jgi:hypothetical protein